MATTFKTLTANDIVNTRTLLHEAIPLTGTIFSGTYSDLNIKTFNHGMFEASFDYPFLSSSANHLLDITHGYSSNSILSGVIDEEGKTGLLPGQAKKINIYNEMASVLVGHDVNGNILEFDKDGNIAGGGTKSKEVFFVNFSRLLYKDEIKKGSFTMTFLTGGTPSAGDNVTLNQRFKMTTDGTLTATDTSIGAISDQRLKENIQDYTYDVAKFKQFKPRTFDWKYPEAHTNEETTGFVAQEV